MNGNLQCIKWFLEWVNENKFSVENQNKIFKATRRRINEQSR